MSIQSIGMNKARLSYSSTKALESLDRRAPRRDFDCCCWCLNTFIAVMARVGSGGVGKWQTQCGTNTYWWLKWMPLGALRLYNPFVNNKQARRLRGERESREQSLSGYTCTEFKGNQQHNVLLNKYSQRQDYKHSLKEKREKKGHAALVVATEAPGSTCRHVKQTLFILYNCKESSTLEQLKISSQFDADQSSKWIEKATARRFTAVVVVVVVVKCRGGGKKMNHQLTRIASKEGGKKGSSHTMFCIQQNDDVNKRQSQQLLLGGESERAREQQQHPGTI